MNCWGPNSAVLHWPGWAIPIIRSGDASQMSALTDAGLASWLHGLGHRTHLPDKWLTTPDCSLDLGFHTMPPACYQQPVLQQEDEQGLWKLKPLVKRDSSSTRRLPGQLTPDMLPYPCSRALGWWELLLSPSSTQPHHQNRREKWFTPRMLWLL